MGSQFNGLSSGNMMPAFNIQPRVFVRQDGEEYAEIIGIKSFERRDRQGETEGEISFIADEEQSANVKSLLAKDADHYLDVKMEFLMGMLMVMTFSGFVKSASGNRISFSVSTPITTDVQDIAL